ncbi:MAG: flagellar hook-basal body complex protein FliE [Phycisphaerae bacterium]|nr:flagellar hook-basal body complex protein FliE [Phycisphaerae bacterium]
MADPLGLIGQGAGGVRGAMGPGVRVGGGAEAGAGGAFKDALLKNIDEVNRLQQEANLAAEDLATGKRADVENVLLATEKADAAFRMLVQLRNKVQTAYDELKQVRI